MRLIPISIAIAVLFLTCPNPRAAHALEFEYIEPDDATRLILGAQGRVHAHGQIDLKDAVRLRRLMFDHDIKPGSDFIIDSPGGVVQGALDLGREIRKHRLNTRVGRKGGKEGRTLIHKNTRCLSACALAFLGGHFRFVEEGKEYGVHRFDALPGAVTGIDRAQALSGRIISYLNDMQVSTELFTLMSKTPSETMRILTPEELRELKVATGGIEEVQWKLSTHQGRLHYTGNRNTVWGRQVLDFECREGAVRLAIFFESLNREEDLKIHLSRTVMLDSQTHDIRKFGGGAPLFVENYAVYSFPAPPVLLDALEKSREFAFISRFNEENPLFLGFQGFPIHGQQEGIRAIRKCAKDSKHHR
jgi:hypothetical protein